MEARKEAADGDRQLTFEMEAAEALAGLARSSSFERPRQQVAAQNMDQSTNARQFCRNTATTAPGPVITLKTVDTTFSQACVASHQSKVSSALRRKLTEAEKEAQRLRRVLSNRESARQTIRRRQAVHLELTGKAANLLEENTYLKKEKELAMKKYNSLKDENEFLKAQGAKRKQAEPEEIQERPKSPYAETPRSAAAAAASNTPVFLRNQPYLVPFFWPSYIPLTENLNSLCATASDGTGASQFHVPIWDEFCSNQGLKCSAGITKSGTPLLVLPVPWLLPLLTHGTHESCSQANDTQNTTSPMHQCRVHSSLAASMHGDCRQLSSHQNPSAAAFNLPRISSTNNVHGSQLNFPFEGGSQLKGPCIHPKGTAHDHVLDVASVSAQTTHFSMDKTRQGLFISPSRKSRDSLTTEARRMRKELMKLKNIHNHDARLL